MTEETKRRTYNALTTASEMIRQDSEQGVDPEERGEKDEKGLIEYQKACLRASKLIDTLAKRYE